MPRYTATITITIDADTDEDAAELAQDLADHAMYDSDFDGFAARGIARARVSEIYEPKARGLILRPVPVKGA